MLDWSQAYALPWITIQLIIGQTGVLKYG